jgi:hypothetical protein
MNGTSLYMLSRDDVQILSDRLFSRAVSTITTYSPKEKADLIAASRTMRALLRHYEHTTGRQLSTVILIPEVT